MKSTLAYIALVGVALLVVRPAIADVVDIQAQQDNTLYENENGDLSNGSGEHFFAGRTAQGSDEDQRRGLVQFDVGASVPAGATINSVTLTLRMSRTQAGTTPVRLQRLLADWGEGASDAGGQEGDGGSSAPGDATWIHRFYSSVFWSTPGGDYVGTPSATTSVGGTGFYDWSSSELRVDVQFWVDNPGSNYGWIVIGDESSSMTAKRFDSRENTNTARRPVLTIDFTPPAGTGACCFDDGTCQILTQSDCNAQSGDYRGDDTSCTPNPCPQPVGACCFGDGSCLELTAEVCLDLGGAYQGDETDCSPNPCDVITGACCFDDGTCADLTEDECASQGGDYQGDNTDCVNDPCPLVPFVDPLPIPPVLQPETGEPGGEAYYEIAITEFSQQLHRDLPPTTVWGYAGSYPASTIEAGRDLPVTVKWINDLRDENGEPRTEHYLPVDLCMHGPDHEGSTPRTVVHLHGGHVEMEDDGYPEWTFLPGEFEIYNYPNHQLPATLWYHDHALGITRLNVYMGLAGFYLLRDAFENALDLPAGEFEIAAVVQDRTFNPDGSFQYPESWQQHFFGDTLLVNGKVWPYLEVTRGKYRFRLLNGSNSRSYTLALSDGSTFHQIGTDGGLLPAPVPMTALTLIPGERADVVMDFEGYEPGTEIILTNSAPAPFPGEPGVGVIPNVMKFIVTDQPGHTAPLPAELRPVDVIDESEAVEHREFLLRKQNEPCAGQIWLINDLGWDDITEFPVLGTTEVWTFANASGTVHPMHMHLVMFQVLDRQPFELVDDEIVPIGKPVPPPPNEAGWKDTVGVYPGELTRVIARFEDYTGLFAYHCHILEHEDHEMMRQFHVVAPCPADLDGNDIVDSADLAVLLGSWGDCPGCPADIDGNDVVNSADLANLLGSWGPCF